MMTLLGTGLRAGLFALATAFIVGRIAIAGGGPRLAAANAAALKPPPRPGKTGAPNTDASETPEIQPRWTVFVRGL
jgi:hypothetical protein